MFCVKYVDGNGKEYPIGNVKIGQFNMKECSPELAETFYTLDDDFFL